MHAAAGNTESLLILLIVILTVLVIDAGLFFAWIMSGGLSRERPEKPLFAPQWSLVDVWIGTQLILALLSALFIGSGAVLAITGVIDLGSLPEALSGHATPAMMIFILASVVVQNLVTIAVPVAFIKWKYHQSLSSIGLTPLPSLRSIRTGLLAGIALLFVGEGFQRLLMAALSHLLSPQRLKELQEASQAVSAEQLANGVRGHPGLFLLLLVGAAIFAPLGEEIFFRGFLFNAAKRRLGLIAGVLISATIFGLAHGGPLLVLGIIPMGIFLALMYEWTGSLWVTITMHAVNNGTALVALYFTHAGK